MKKLFDGQNLYLRTITTQDADTYYESLLDSDINRLTGTQRIFNKDFIYKYIESKTNAYPELLLFILLKENDEVIGDIQLNDIDLINRRANIRLSINSETHQGKGYGKEAMVLVMEYGFGIMNLHRIDLEVYSFNKNAIKAYEKIGFKREGIKRDVLFYNHEYHDCIVMSMLEDEYRTKYARHFIPQ
jgi:RimJ/RimL family protein N-acetyltransferase